MTRVIYFSWIYHKILYRIDKVTIIYTEESFKLQKIYITKWNLGIFCIATNFQCLVLTVSHPICRSFSKIRWFYCRIFFLFKALFSCPLFSCILFLYWVTTNLMHLLKHSKLSLPLKKYFCSFHDITCNIYKHLQFEAELSHIKFYISQIASRGLPIGWLFRWFYCH